MREHRIIELYETTSTNQYTAELLKEEKLQEGTVISAMKQSSGRGTGNNSWESEEGKNITISMIFYPEFLPLENQFMINKVASLGVFDAVEKLLGGNESISIKWPNDIYVGYRKISGMLIENSISGSSLKHTIVGVGLNINQEIFTSDAPNPVSLKMLSGIDYDLQTCLSMLIDCLFSRYEQLRNKEYALLDWDYLCALYGLNELGSFVWKSGKINAIIRGIASTGKLLLETEEGKMIECGFGEVSICGKQYSAVKNPNNIF